MPAPRSYEEMGVGKLPRWLRGTWADKLTSIAFGVLDVINAGAKQAAKAGLIDACPEDAVEAHARSRNLERIVGEALPALRLRVAEAWTTWAESGTKVGLQALLRLYSGAAGLFVFDIVNDDWTGGATGTWDDANADNWSRLWVVIEQPHSWTREVVGTGIVVGPDQLVGISMTGTELSTIRRIFRTFRPAHVVGGEVVVLLDDPPSTADDMRLDHSVAGADAVFMPLQVQMVGYRGAIVGPGLIVGETFL